MNSFLEQLEFLRPGWTDILEIAIVAWLIYRLLLVLQRTRAMQIMLGVVFLFAVYGLALLLDLILIRTLMRQGEQLRAHAGCGIVADSDPDNEAEELMWKLQPLLDAVT